MLTYQQLQQLKSAYASSTGIGLKQIRQQIGNPTDKQIADAAINGLQSDDRNERVLMLRILGYQHGDDAMNGILQGLRDKERRVRDVAVQSSVHFVHYPEIANKLSKMATDAQEKRKIREKALSTLLGVGAPVRSGDLPGTVVKVIEPLLQQGDYRERILHGLVQISEGKAVAKLLKQFTDEGTSEEAAMAEKALGGYHMVNIGHYAEGPQRDKVLQECELASGRVFYWVER